LHMAMYSVDCPSGASLASAWRCVSDSCMHSATHTSAGSCAWYSSLAGLDGRMALGAWLGATASCASDAPVDAAPSAPWQSAPRAGARPLPVHYTGQHRAAPAHAAAGPRPSLRMLHPSLCHAGPALGCSIPAAVVASLFRAGRAAGWARWRDASCSLQSNVITVCSSAPAGRSDPSWEMSSSQVEGGRTLSCMRGERVHRQSRCFPTSICAPPCSVLARVRVFGLGFASSYHRQTHQIATIVFSDWLGSLRRLQLHCHTPLPPSARFPRSSPSAIEVPPQT
jgi:hypothetical protein